MVCLRFIDVRSGPTRYVRLPFTRSWRRWHHGTDGILLSLIGMVLMYHDRADWRLWVRDLVVGSSWGERS